MRRGQQKLERLSSEAAKYGTAKVLKRTARAEVPLHVSGARPSWGPHPGLPWPQRPLQEDQSRYAENQPSCVRDVVGKEMNVQDAPHRRLGDSHT